MSRQHCDQLLLTLAHGARRGTQERLQRELGLPTCHQKFSRWQPGQIWAICCSQEASTTAFLQLLRRIEIHTFQSSFRPNVDGKKFTYKLCEISYELKNIVRFYILITKDTILKTVPLKHL